MWMYSYSEEIYTLILGLLCANKLNILTEWIIL